MGPYSMDLRQRIAHAVDHQEGSRRQLARRFCVSLSFITRLLALRRQTGNLAPGLTGADLHLLSMRQGCNACGSWFTTNPMPSWTNWPSSWAVVA